MILYKDVKPIEHVLLHPICVVSHLICTCKHCNIKLSLSYWTHCSCWWIYHFKNHRFPEIFDNQAETATSTKEADLGGKNSQWELCMVACGKTPTSVTRSEHLRIYCRVIVTQQRPRVEQTAR